MLPEPVITVEPVVLPEPIITPDPVVLPEPVITVEPVVVPEPVITPEPEIVDTIDEDVVCECANGLVASVKEIVGSASIDPSTITGIDTVDEELVEEI